MSNLETLRFYSDSGHGWLEVPTVDVAKSGVIPSKLRDLPHCNS